MVRSQLSSFWRILLLLAVITAGIVYGQTSTYAAQPTHINMYGSRICFLTQPSCLAHNPLSLKTVQVEARRKTIEHTTTSVHLPKTLCLANKQANVAYSYALNNALTATNTKVDSTRQSAEANGESYKIFDAQVNSLFASYNTEAQQAYATYLKALHGCAPLRPSPLLFQMFTP